MRPPPRQAITAVILAGGRGSRMGGRDKARLRHRRESLIQTLQNDIAPWVGEIIVVRRNPRAKVQTAKRAWDAPHYAGPVAGLEAGLRRASRHWCLCLPVDSKHPPRDLLRQLSRAGGGFVRHGHDDYFLHSLIPSHKHTELRQFLATGGRSAANACRHIHLAPVPIRKAPRTIWSINTRHEWRQTQRRRP